MNPEAILASLAETGADQFGESLREAAKALSTLGAGTDLGNLGTGAGALRAENMDPILASATLSQEHFKLFKRLLPDRRESWSVIDQQMVKTDIGAFPGSALADEFGSGQVDRQGEYNRLITELGLFFSRRSVSVVTALQASMQQRGGHVDFSVLDEEDLNAALEILNTVEFSAFYGDKAVNAKDINGLIPNLIANAPDHITDLRGDALTSHVPLSTLANKITDQGNWGKPDLAFMSGLVKADLDATLEKGYRLNLDAGVPNTEVGALLKGMRYSSVGVADGHITFDPSAYLNEAKRPVEAVRATNCTLTAPASLTAVAAQDVANSKWVDLSGKYTVAGAYYYAVEACSNGEVSTCAKLAGAVTVAVGDKVTLTITAGSAKEVYYKVYRGRKNGTNGLSDMRLVGTVKKAGATTTFVDLNTYIPGSSEVPILTMEKSAIRWVQFLPMTKIPFAMTSLAYNWGAFLLGALRISMPKKHGVVRNILATGLDWHPFK